MIQRQCSKCEKKHNIYYLIRIDGVRVLFMLCPKMKGNGETFTIFLPMEKGLDIPTYLINSKAYESLKESTAEDGDFTKEERYTIDLWRSAQLSGSKMTKKQIETVKRYILGHPLW